MADNKVIDINMHMLPTNLFTDEEILNGFLYSAPFTFGMKAYLAKTPDGKKRQMVLEYPEGKQILNYVEGDYTLEAKISAMDDAGIDMALLRMPVWQEWLPLDICKVVNDQAAQMQRDSEGRLRFNAVLPPWGRKEDIKELERCIDMGAVGVQFACCYGDNFLDDELFKPYLKVLNDKKIPAVIHHTPGQNTYGNFDEYTVLRRELGRIHVQAAAVSREVYSGMFDEFPDLKFIHTMFGGNFFALQERPRSACVDQEERGHEPPDGKHHARGLRPIPQEQHLLRHDAPHELGQETSSSARSRYAAPTTCCSARRSPSSTSGWRAPSSPCNALDMDVRTQNETAWSSHGKEEVRA